MTMKATDMKTIVAAKATVTPMISTILPFSLLFIAFSRASSSLACAVVLIAFSCSSVSTGVVDLNSLSSGLVPIKEVKY